MTRGYKDQSIVRINGSDFVSSIVFEGSTSNGFETTIQVTDPTLDRTITFPDVTGNVVTTGDTGTVTSTMIANATIVNDDISSTAAIAHSKLANATAGQILLCTTTTGVVTATTISGDITITGAGVAAISSGVIVDADINASAAISIAKLAAGTSAQIIVANASGTPNYVSLSGDATISSTGAMTISNLAITLGKLASTVQQSLVPVGTILSTLKNTADSGFIMLDGSSQILENTHSSLFTIVNGLSGFSLSGSSPNRILTTPSMASRMLMGGTTLNNRGTLGGNNSVSLTTTELPSHNHTVPNTSVNISLTNGTHFHPEENRITNTQTSNYYLQRMGGSGPNYDVTSAFTTRWDSIEKPQTANASCNVSVASASTNVTTAQNNGSGGSFSVVNQHLTVNYQIKF